jgi:alpha-mannosidase
MHFLLVVCRRGELYLEIHRGTYTSHSANKAANRRCELLLRDVEALGGLAVACGAAGYRWVAV